MNVHDSSLSPDMLPDTTVSVRENFGLDQDMRVPAFSRRTEYVPDIDEDYQFDPDTTMAILAGFAHNKRVMIQGYHGTGKSTHIEQVSARLNWPCIRVNLDSHISRIDLVGKDAIVIEDGQQITSFKEGILPWALQHPTALVFDEYDAGRPDVMFVIQRVLEVEGRLTLLDQNRIIRPHDAFRLFSTTNTVGLGDTTGLYHGTQQINQGQMDRWNIVTTLNYLPHDMEVDIVYGKAKSWQDHDEGRRTISNMVAVADLTRKGFVNGGRVRGDVAAYGAALGGERGHLPRSRLRLPGVVPQQVRRIGAADRGRVLPTLHGRGSGRCDTRHHPEGLRSAGRSRRTGRGSTAPDQRGGARSPRTTNRRRVRQGCRGRAWRHIHDAPVRRTPVRGYPVRTG